MAQPVKGFLSSSGQFYETEEGADFHDAALVLQKSLLRHFHNDRQSNEALEEKCKVVHDFINAHTDAVANYIRCKDNMLLALNEKEDKIVCVQPPLEVQEENPSDPDLEGDGRDWTERTQSSSEDETMVDGRSADDTGGLANEAMGTEISDPGDQEADHHVESDVETEGRVSEDGDGGDSSSTG